MYSQTAKTLIGIAVGHLLKPVAWISENGCKFHVETSASAAANGQSWRALCGATGDCYFIHSAKAVRPEMRCATCQELSTTGIQDIADLSTGNAPVIDGLTVGDEGVGGTVEGHGTGISAGTANRQSQRETLCGTFPVKSAGDEGESEIPLLLPASHTGSEYQASPVDSQISLIERLIPKVLPDADFCHCGRPATLTCPCGAQICPAHFYDGEGQHVEAQGFCADCVDLIQAEQHGIERCGRAEAR